MIGGMDMQVEMSNYMLGIKPQIRELIDLLEKEFDYKLLKQLYKSGLRCFNWGLESGSQKVLDDMKKELTLILLVKY